MGAAPLIESVHNNRLQISETDSISHKRVGKTNDFDRRIQQWKRDFIGSNTGIEENDQNWFAAGTSIATDFNTYLNMVGSKDIVLLLVVGGVVQPDFSFFPSSGPPFDSQTIWVFVPHIYGLRCCKFR